MTFKLCKNHIGMYVCMSTYMQGGLQEFLIGVTNVEFMGFGALGLQSLKALGFEGF